MISLFDTDLLTGRVECCRHIGQEEGLKQDEGIRMVAMDGNS